MSDISKYEGMSETEERMSSETELEFMGGERDGKKSVIFEAHELREELEEMPLSKDMNQSVISSSKPLEQKFDESFSKQSMHFHGRSGIMKPTIRFEKQMFDEASIDDRYQKRHNRPEHLNLIKLEEIEVSPMIRNEKKRATAVRRETRVSRQKSELKRQSTNKTTKSVAPIKDTTSYAHNPIPNSPYHNMNGGLSPINAVLNHPSPTSNFNNNDYQHGEQQVFFDKEIPLIFGGLNIDRLFIYNYYYPYNNCNYVIEYYRKMLGKSSYKIKSTKQQSDVNMSKKSKGDALIEFRNQQRYFMKNKNVNKIPKVNRGFSPKRGRSVFKKDPVGFSDIFKESKI